MIWGDFFFQEKGGGVVLQEGKYGIIFIPINSTLEVATDTVYCNRVEKCVCKRNSKVQRVQPVRHSHCMIILFAVLLW